MADENALQEITAKLESGIQELFESDKYAEYLRVMSRFHRYSTRNIRLIHMQMPEASHVASYNSWKNNFSRQVKKGERGIKILAPTPYVRESAGVTARFREVTVFDVSQTTGEPLPSLAEPLTGNVDRYGLFMDALRATSPLPVVFEPLEDDKDGLCFYGDRIALREGMSEVQTVSAAIHEITHAKLHDREPPDKDRDRRFEEIESESVSYAVCQYYGIDTGANSFGYLAEWSRGRDLQELNASLDTIRKTAAELIDGIDENYHALAKERGIDLSADAPVVEPPPQEVTVTADRPTPGTVYARYNDQIVIAVRRDEAYTNAVLNADEQTARVECDNAVSRAVMDRYAKNHSDIELYRQYTENEVFKERLNDYVFSKSYLEPRTTQREAAKQSPAATLLTPEMPKSAAELGHEGMILAILAEQKRLDPALTKTKLLENEVNMRFTPPGELITMYNSYFFREQPAEQAADVNETLEAKYDRAFRVLVDALRSNEELLAIAATGAGWMKGTGRAAVFDGGHYEKLMDIYGAEFADVFADNRMATRLNNTVRGEAYRRLDAVAYNRYILDDYADITKSGQLDIYETPYPEDSENTGVLVHLTERLTDGGVHDYGYIYGYDPNDTRTHAINEYLSLKSFATLRESVFGKLESKITLNYKETEPVGSTVLRRLLYTDGMFNREMKRTRVEVLPPMGKYSVYTQHLKGVIGDDTFIHVGTDSGYLLPLGVSRTRFEEQFVEAQIDSIFEKAPKLLDDALADPEKFARFEWAAITGRFEEVEQHNDVYKNIRNEKDRIKREEISAQEAAAKKEAKNQYIEQFKTNADIIESGGNFKLEAMDYSGKNNLLELFTLYDIDVPLATKGWFNQKLISFEVSASGGFSYRSYQNKGRKASYMGDAAYNKLVELRNAVKAVPIAEKLAQKGLVIDAEQERPAEQDNEIKNGGEDLQYTEIQQKGFDIAKKYESLPLQDRLNIIAETFGCKTASVETKLCTGKYRGMSDILLRLDNGASMPIGIDRTAQAKSAAVINKCVNDTFARYNPEILAEIKTRATAALSERETADNAVAAEKGLKPYTFLSVELCNGAEGDGHVGWYYVALAIEDNIIGLVESGLNYDIARGVLSEKVSRPNYFVAGGLRDSDADFVFNNVGHSSFNGSYQVVLSDSVRQRAAEKLNELDSIEKMEAAPVQRDVQVNDILRIKDKQWLVEKIDGDFSIHLKNIDPNDIQSNQMFMGRWKERLEAEGFSIVTGQAMPQQTNLTPNDKDFWRGEIADFLATNDGKMELDDLELPPTGNHGGLGKFFEVFGERAYKHEFAAIVAQENTRRTGEPWVTFGFCEGGEYRPDFLRTPTAMLFVEADAFIRSYEPKVREILDGGYDKLDVTTYIKRDDNEVYPISDRYDIGDSKKVSGLYNVLKAETDFYYANPKIFGWNDTADGFAEDKALTYADIEILKKAVTSDHPYVEVEKVIRYADGDRLDQRVFNNGEILPFSEADSKIKTEEKAMRDRHMKKHGSPGDGDEELSLAVHFKLPGDSEPSVHRFSYLIGDYDEARSGLLKHFEMGAAYFNLCLREGDYGNVNAMLGGKTPDDAIRLVSDYNKTYHALRDSMADIPTKSAMEQEKPEAATLDLLLPDPSWTVPEMIEYVYTEPDMYPLSVGRALELFDADHTIYLLYSDNTEAMAFERDEIITHSEKGFCGIERGDWERSPVRAAQIAIAANSEGRKESELLHSDGKHFGIYQVRDGAECRDFRFAPMSELEGRGLAVDRSNYRLVHTMPFSEDFQLINDKNDFLNQIYEVFNVNPPANYSGRSVSVSDVIIINHSGDISSHFVDSKGFVELPGFTGNETNRGPEINEGKISLVENEQNPAAEPGHNDPSTAELKADADAGKPILLSDLSKAVNSERQNRGKPAAPKGKPSMLGRLEQKKQKVARRGQPDTQKSKDLEV